MLKSNPSNRDLGKILKLADTDTDGMFDIEEFALAMHLNKVNVAGYGIPDYLSKHLIPPSKRSGASVLKVKIENFKTGSAQLKEQLEEGKDKVRQNTNTIFNLQ
jgi:hypothetical protein